MRQVGVELNYVVGEIFLEDFLHRIAAGRAVASLAGTRHQVDVGVLLLKAADLVGGAVGRVVVDEEDGLRAHGVADSGDQDRDVVALVVGGDDEHEGQGLGARD